MAWVVLFAAGVLEIVWAFSMKLSQGFTRPVPSFVTLTSMLGSFWLLATALRTIPLGTAYTIWTGIGAIGALVIGIVFLSEPYNARRLVAAALIISGLALMYGSDPSLRSE